MGNDQPKERGLYKADSVPPPDDAYSAPTRIGEVPSEAWSEAGEGQPEETRLLSVGAIDNLVTDSIAPKEPSDAKSKAVATGAKGAKADDKIVISDEDLKPDESSENSIPEKVYDEDEGDGDSAETLLHPSAKPYHPPPPLPKAASSKAPSGLPAQDGQNAASWPFAPELGSERVQSPSRREIMVGVVMFVAAVIVFGGAALVWHLNR